MWIDSHAHLTMFEEREVAAALDRAVECGVAGVLVPATGAEDLDRAVELAAAFPARVVAAVGVHPHEAASLDAALKRRIEAALHAEGVVAVGEIGLDYHYMSSPREDQLAALRWQLDLAAAAGVPVVLHNRESWDDLAGELGERAGRLGPGVCHSFTESAAAARRVTDMGLYVGISGMVTFKRADEIRAMAATVPPERLLVETDSPYLAPEPRRGRRNEPAYVRYVGERLAGELGVEATWLAAQTTTSFRSLFKVPDGWPPQADRQ